PPVVEFGALAPESDKARQQRLQRDSLHGKDFYPRKIADPGAKEVNGQPESVMLTFVDGVTILKPGQIPDPKGMPVSCSAIVVGTVVQGRAFVSEGRDFVHSDYQISVDEVLKADAEKPLSVGQQLTAWVPGGSVHFPAGHTKHFLIAGR